jgi:hypothetical protein
LKPKNQKVKKKVINPSEHHEEEIQNEQQQQIYQPSTFMFECLEDSLQKIKLEDNPIIQENESMSENKPEVVSKEEEELDDELNVINKIYDRFYVQQLPNKRKNTRFRTKYVLACSWPY